MTSCASSSAWRPLRVASLESLASCSGVRCTSMTASLRNSAYPVNACVAIVVIEILAGGFGADEQQQGQQGGQDSEPGGDEAGGESGRDARVFLQQKGKEIRGGGVHATHLARGVVAQAPLIRFAQSYGGDVLEAQTNDECGVAQSVHLVDFEGMPENHGSQLNGHAEKDNPQTELPENPAESGAVTQQQRNGNHGQEFDGSGDVAVAPGEIAAPDDVLGVEKDISHQQPQTGEQISLDGRTKAPPNQQGQQEGENEQRVEQEDGFLGSDERAQQAFAERRVPGEIRRAAGIEFSLLRGEHRQVGGEERAETIELVEAVEKQEAGVTRRGHQSPGAKTREERAAANVFEPQGQNQEQQNGGDVQGRGQAREQVGSGSETPEQQRPDSAGAQPVVLETQGGEREEHEEVVFHHVLRVVEEGGAEKERECSGHGLGIGELEQAQEAQANQNGEDAQEDVRGVTHHDLADARVALGEAFEPFGVREICADNVRREHEQALSYSIPGVDAAIPAGNSEIGVIVRRHRQ